MIHGAIILCSGVAAVGVDQLLDAIFALEDEDDREKVTQGRSLSTSTKATTGGTCGVPSEGKLFLYNERAIFTWVT